MSVDVDTLTGKLLDAGRALGGNIWQHMETFAGPELKKIALQIATIAENINDFTPEGAKALLQLQVQASIGVIVAMTQLIMTEVQNAINAILDAVRGFVNGKLPFPLL